MRRIVHKIRGPRAPGARTVCGLRVANKTTRWREVTCKRCLTRAPRVTVTQWVF